MSASTRQAGEVLLYDGTGRHEGISTALHLAEQGASVHLVTIDDSLGQEIEYSSRAVYRKQFRQRGIKVTVDHHLVRVERDGSNQLSAVFRHELTGQELEICAPRIIVERGTQPLDEVFNSLRDLSRNKGVTSLSALISPTEAREVSNSEGFELHRIGDAVASRNIHASIYEAFRLSLTL